MVDGSDNIQMEHFKVLGARNAKLKSVSHLNLKYLTPKILQFAPLRTHNHYYKLCVCDELKFIKQQHVFHIPQASR